MSAPETNALSPAPTMITTRTSGLSRNSVSAVPSPSHISSDMALRFSGLLKVMTPTPSVTLCRILPSAWDLSACLGTSSISGIQFGFRSQEGENGFAQLSSWPCLLAPTLPAFCRSCMIVPIRKRGAEERHEDRRCAGAYLVPDRGADLGPA